MTGSRTVKGRNLRRDGRASLVVDDEAPPFAYVRIDGTAEISEDLDEMLIWSTRIAFRYMGPELGGVLRPAQRGAGRAAGAAAPGARGHRGGRGGLTPGATTSPSPAPVTG